MGRANGLTTEKLAAIADYETSALFDETEKLVLAYCDRMCKTPVDVPDDLFAKVRKRFSDEELVELNATIAWENFRARFNRALLIGADGFSEGSFCVLPARPPVPQLP